LEETIAATGRLLTQTDQRLAGNRVIPDRLVSLSDPDARPIRKGKPRHPTQFGYTLLVAEDERGFIADHQVEQGNPPDAPQLLPSVQRVMALTGRPPGTVVGDRGFGTAANDQAMEGLGVKRVGLQRTGTPGKARLAVERTRRSDGCATGGSGSRPASATSSAASGYGAPGCAGWAAPAPGWGWGSSPTTCSA
jgi:transposase, IS5 family